MHSSEAVPQGLKNTSKKSLSLRVLDIAWQVLLLCLTRFLSRDDSKAFLEEKNELEKAPEEYQAAYAKYEKERTKLLDRVKTQHEIKEQAKQNFTSLEF